jgi:hypothetical protein
LLLGGLIVIERVKKFLEEREECRHTHTLLVQLQVDVDVEQEEEEEEEEEECFFLNLLRFVFLFFGCHYLYDFALDCLYHHFVISKWRTRRRRTIHSQSLSSHRLLSFRLA